MTNPTDATLAATLRSIGGWHVGCENEKENVAVVEAIKQAGYVTTRIHYAPMIPEGAPAYELTDAGLLRIGELSGADAMQSAEDARRWYRGSASQWLAGYRQGQEEMRERCAKIIEAQDGMQGWKRRIVVALRAIPIKGPDNA